MNFNFEQKYKLPISKENLVCLLNYNKIKFDLFKHEHLNTVKESKILQNLIFPKNKESVHIKNLYLRDKRKRNFLITCEQDKNIDLKILKEKIKSDRLSFASQERLYNGLGVFPGAVSPFCMLNGIKNNVKFFCDYNLRQFKKVYLHPFVSNMTICLDIDDLEKFLKKYHISINWINM